MYSHLVAAPKPEEAYQFFRFEGPKPIMLDYRGTKFSVSKGDRFGVRKSANGKQIRLVLENNVNRVFTIDLDTAKRLAKHVGAERATASLKELAQIGVKQ